MNAITVKKPMLVTVMRLPKSFSHTRNDKKVNKTISINGINMVVRIIGVFRLACNSPIINESFSESSVFAIFAVNVKPCRSQVLSLNLPILESIPLSALNITSFASYPKA